MNFFKINENEKISKKLNNGEFDYYLFLEIINLNDFEDKPKNKYMCSISAVSVQEAGEQNLKDAFKCIGIKNINQSEKQKAIALNEYGVKSTLYSEQGNNLKQLLKNANKQYDLINTLFGFYMDKPINAIGNNGWDFIKGNIGFKSRGKVF